MGTIEQDYEELDWWINECCINKNYLDSKDILWFVPLQQRPFTLLTLKINKTFTISKWRSTHALKYFIYGFTCYLSNKVSIHPFVHLSNLCPPIHACMYPLVRPSVCLSVNRSVHRSNYPFVLSYVYLSVHFFIHPFIFI